MTIHDNILYNELLPGDYVQISKSKDKDIPKGCFAVIKGGVGVTPDRLVLILKPTSPFVTNEVTSKGKMEITIGKHQRKFLRRSKRKTILRSFWRWRNGKPELGAGESFKAEVKLFTLDITKL
jgi:hypothetical protein